MTARPAAIHRHETKRWKNKRNIARAAVVICPCRHSATPRARRMANRHIARIVCVRFGVCVTNTYTTTPRSMSIKKDAPADVPPNDRRRTPRPRNVAPVAGGCSLCPPMRKTAIRGMGGRRNARNARTARRVSANNEIQRIIKYSFKARRAA